MKKNEIIQKKQIEGGKDAQLSGLESDENIGTSQTRSNHIRQNRHW